MVLINAAVSISKDRLLRRILVSLESLLKKTALLTWIQDRQPSAWRQKVPHHSIGFARKILNCSKSHTVGWDPRLVKNYLQAPQNSCGNSVECLNTNKNTYLKTGIYVSSSYSKTPGKLHSLEHQLKSWDVTFQSCNDWTIKLTLSSGINTNLDQAESFSSACTDLTIFSQRWASLMQPACLKIKRKIKVI